MAAVAVQPVPLFCEQVIEAVTNPVPIPPQLVTVPEGVKLRQTAYTWSPPLAAFTASAAMCSWSGKQMPAPVEGHLALYPCRVKLDPLFVVRLTALVQPETLSWAAVPVGIAITPRSKLPLAPRASEGSFSPKTPVV